MGKGSFAYFDLVKKIEVCIATITRAILHQMSPGKSLLMNVEGLVGLRFHS